MLIPKLSLAFRRVAVTNIEEETRCRPFPWRRGRIGEFGDALRLVGIDRMQLGD